MDIPSSLLSAIRTFRASLDDELYHVEHDTDMDGFASGVIATVALRRLGFQAYPYPVERSKTFVPETGALVFTDIALDNEPTETVRRASAAGTNVYAIDHHPWERGIEEKLHAFVNPHLIPGMPNPSQWNAGFLAYLTFRDVAADYGWLAAISVYTDRCVTPWSKPLLDDYGYDRVKKAGDMLTAYIAVKEDLGELDWLLLNRIYGLEDVLNYEPFLEAEKVFEEAIDRYVNDPKAHALFWDERRKICVIETEEPYLGINAVVSTRISFKPEYMDWVVVVLGRDKHGNVKGSLRCQHWEKRGRHMGKLASKLAAQLGGVGGGHPMAAGMRLPPTAGKEELVELLQSLL